VSVQFEKSGWTFFVVLFLTAKGAKALLMNTVLAQDFTFAKSRTTIANCFGTIKSKSKAIQKGVYD
jgi:hypothetical protein